LTLMEVARLSVKFGVEPPDLVRMENEIDQEIEQQPEEIMVEPMVQLKKMQKSHSLDDLVSKGRIFIILKNKMSIVYLALS